MIRINLTSSEVNYNLTQIARIDFAFNYISSKINDINVIPMGILAPLLSISLLLYTLKSLVQLRRKYRANKIIYNERNCRAEELKLRELNYNVDKTKLKLMILTSLAELLCILIPLGPAVLTFFPVLTDEIFRFINIQKCGEGIAIKLMTGSPIARIYIGISRGIFLIFLSNLKLLITFLTNVYRERLKYTKFKRHFVYLSIKTAVIVGLDILSYTFIPNLFISIGILLIEYIKLWKAMKQLRWATKWKLMDLQRDHPNEIVTVMFKMGSKAYRLFSHLLSIGILASLLALLFLFNVIPIFNFSTHTNCFLHAIYPIPHGINFTEINIEKSVIDLINTILVLQLNFLLMISTLTIIYPFSFFFFLIFVVELIIWLRRRNKGYPTRRPELVTALLKWHRDSYILKNVMNFNV